MDFIKKQRKINRRKDTRFFSFARRKEDKIQKLILAQDFSLWLICLLTATTMLSGLLILSYIKG